LLIATPGLGVLPAVYAEVAPLAGGNDVFRDGTRWGALAHVGRGEADESVEPTRGAVVAFYASARARVGLVQAALPGAFALSSGAVEADVIGELAPVWRVP